MEITEIILLLAGGIAFVLSFVIPAKKEEDYEEKRGLAKEEIKSLVSEELESVRQHVDDVVEEAVTYSMEKTERSLERLSNEKIMAVSEYSDTVLSEIHKNHEEVMFLYDMLNDKHKNLKNTVSEVDRTVKEAAAVSASVAALQKTSQMQSTVAPDFAQPKPVLSAPAPAPDLQIRPTAQKTAQGAVEGQSAAKGPLVLQPENTGTKKGQADGMIAAPQQEAPFFSLAGQAPVLEVRKKEPAPDTKGVRQAGTFNFTRETDEQGRNYNEKILEMYQKGKSKVAIAKELNLGVGEVKLVIDLYKNL